MLTCESQRLKVNCGAFFWLTPCRLVMPPGLSGRRFGFVGGPRQWPNIVCELTCGSEGLTIVNRADHC